MSALDQVKTYVAAHKKPLAAVAVAGVAGLAYVTRGGSPAAADPAGSTDSGTGASLPNNGELDTTSTDLYNELQPELENVGSRLDDVDSGLSEVRDQIGNGFATAPKAATPSAKKPARKPAKKAPKGRKPKKRAAPRKAAHPKKAAAKRAAPHQRALAAAKKKAPARRRRR